MHIDVIARLDAFHQLRDNWDAVYKADAEAHFFLSSTWMSKWLADLAPRWFILAAKAHADAPYYDAFFPLRLRTERSAGGGFYDEVAMAGNRGADYTGFLCKPGFEEQAAAAFAEHIKTVRWANLHLEFIRASDERVGHFLKAFGPDSFEISRIPKVNKEDGIDNCACPYVILPGSFDEYLGTLTQNTRKKIRKHLRAIGHSEEFRVTHSTDTSFERDLDVLLRLWSLRWSSRKGERLDSILSVLRTMLKHCFESGALFFPILWKGERPLAAKAQLIDREKGSAGALIGARDTSFDGLPPGFILHAYCIRHAIENGLKTYDFMRGNETYKYSFGVKEQRIQHIVVSRKNRRVVTERLNRSSLPELFQHAVRHHRVRQLDEATQIYNQILLVDPRHAPALYGLGHSMAAKGEHAACAKLFALLSRLEPRSLKAWLGLGSALFRLGRFDAAASAFETAAALEPGSPHAEAGLTQSLDRLGNAPQPAAHYSNVSI